MATFPRDFWANVTESGDVALPSEVVDALGIKKPGVVIFQVQDRKVSLRKPPFSSVEEVTGSVPPLKEPKTWDEIKEIVADERAEEYLRKMREGNA
jgi:bifunctional DNA-binding transcriptional regulator/antitoxin component of YhaV-PrlF toxin-antitoxin module